jgi:hypothetical protein
VNRDALGALAELLAAVGVIVSLFYMTREIHPSTRVEKARPVSASPRVVRFDRNRG